KRDAQTRSGRFGHLTVNKRHLRLSNRLHVDLGQIKLASVVEILIERVAKLNNLRFNHLAQQVVSFTSALANTGEDRKAGTCLSDVVDQLHHDNRLAHARAAEQTDLATAQERLNQVDYLDACFKHLQLSRLFFKRRRVPVNRIPLFVFDGTECIDGLADDVQHAAQRSLTYRHRDRATGVDGFHAAHHAIRRQHRNGSHTSLAEVLLNFGDNVDCGRHVETFRGNSKRLIDGRQVVAVKLDVEDGADDLYDFTDMISVRRRHTCP